MKTREPVYSVTQLNQYVKGLLDSDGTLSSLFVRGELSNYKAYPSGHHYFSLKDAEGIIRGVMFKREAIGLQFHPENGMNVIAFGRVAVFPRDGQYQLYCSSITPDGVGELYVAFEQLKKKLFAQGLFDQPHKKPLPRYPKRIALITSPAGAVVRDMVRILGVRWPLTQVSVIPVRVQGSDAPSEICAALAWANQYKVADLIITGRGGGAMEDLWAFNSERVARSIFASYIPVISAVGHEPDITIADFVADLRAATPSNAAELSVPDQNEIYEQLSRLKNRMERSMSRRLELARNVLDRMERNRILADPMIHLDNKRELLDYQRDRLGRGLLTVLGGKRENFAWLAAALDAMSPMKVLSRGYAIAQRESGGVVRTVKDTKTGDVLILRVFDGAIRCEIL